MNQKGYVTRVKELLALEGWYRVEGNTPYDFKFSCRFSDILRCSEFNGKTVHFNSCFKKGGAHEIQVERRCYDSSWAIIYTPDKHGNFLGRCFVQWVVENFDGKLGHLKVDKVYGNRLNVKDIIIMINNKNVECRFSAADTYLPHRAA